MPGPVGLPIPGLTLAAPSQSSASSPFAPSFAVGTGATAGGIPLLVLYAGLALAALYFWKRK